MGEDARPQHEVPYLHIRAPRRVVSVGGEGAPVAKIHGNRAELLALRQQLDRALEAEEGLAPSAAPARDPCNPSDGHRGCTEVLVAEGVRVVGAA